MKFSFLLLLLFWFACGNAQLTVTNVGINNLPRSLRYAGRLVKAFTWRDTLGLNYLLANETGEYRTKDKEGEELRNAAIYVYHYIVKPDSAALLWRVYDEEKECLFDLFLKFVGDGFIVTDLDKNGLAEIWMMYQKQCTSDVSPAQMKIIMYEGTKKYAVRGENRVRVSEKDFMGGQYTLDESFKKGNALFRQFAIKLWEKNKSAKPWE